MTNNPYPKSGIWLAVCEKFEREYPVLLTGEVELEHVYDHRNCIIGGLYTIKGYDICPEIGSTIETWIKVIRNRHFGLLDKPLPLPKILYQSDENPKGLREEKIEEYATLTVCER